MAFVFEKPEKVTEEIDCEKMKNNVEKKEGDSDALQTKKIFPLASKNMEVFGF